MVQCPVILDAFVVPCVTQLVSQGDHIAERAVVVGEDAALSDGFHTGAESTAGLAFPGEEVNPLLIESISEENVSIVVDLSEAQVGTDKYAAQIMVHSAFAGVGAMNNYAVMVTLTEAS